MKSVCQIVLNNFTSDSRVIKECNTLLDAGYQVKVLALHEDDLPEVESVGNLCVKRVKLISKPWSKAKIVQLFKYFEFLIRAIYFARSFSHIHCNDLNTLPIGVAVKVLLRKKVHVIYDAHEYQIEIEDLSVMEKRLSKFIEKLLIPYANSIITVNDSIAEEYSRLYSIEKPLVVLNAPKYFDLQESDLLRKNCGIPDDRIIFLFQGVLAVRRGVRGMLQAFSNDSESNAVIVFMGNGPLREEVIGYADKSDRIFFHEAVSPDVLLNYTSSADFGLVFIDNSCLNNYYCAPNKFFEYLMAGLPVIVSNVYELKKIVNKYELGFVTECEDVDLLEQTIQTASNTNREKLALSVSKVRKIFCWENQEPKFLSAYK